MAVVQCWLHVLLLRSSWVHPAAVLLHSRAVAVAGLMLLGHAGASSRNQLHEDATLIWKPSARTLICQCAVLFLLLLLRVLYMLFAREYSAHQECAVGERCCGSETCRWDSQLGFLLRMARACWSAAGQSGACMGGTPPADVVGAVC